MMQQARDRGLLPAAEVNSFSPRWKWASVQVREIMVPRPDVHASRSTRPSRDACGCSPPRSARAFRSIEGSLDHILGFVHIKDMLWILLDRARRTEEHCRRPFSAQALLREVLIVPETKPASELLAEFRARRTGLAMVVDEFGSILGLVTLEDILEQMVGEIHDEFDVVERPLGCPTAR